MYLPGSMMPGASGVRELSFLQIPTTGNMAYVDDNINRTTYTFSNVPVGAASSNRFIILVCGADNVGSIRSLAAAPTCNGSNMTLVHAIGSASDGVEGVMYYTKLTTGTTAEFIITWSAAMGDCGIGIYAVTSSTGNMSVRASSTSTSGTLTSVVAARGDVIIGVDVENGGSGALMSWTNSSEAFTTVIANDNIVSSYEGVTGPVTRTQAASPSSGDHASIMAAFQP